MSFEAPRQGQEGGRRPLSEDDEVNRLCHLNGLYDELEMVTEQALPDMAVKKVLEHLPDWEYAHGRGPKEAARRFSGLLPDPPPALKIPRPPRPGRTIQQDQEKVTMTVDQVTGGDLRSLILLDRQLTRAKWGKEFAALALKGRVRLQQKRGLLSVTEAEKTGIPESNLFTDRALLFMKLTTHFSNYQDMAKALGINSGTITRALAPTRDQLGITTTVDMMLAAIALGAAKVDHVPEGRTRLLKPHLLKFMVDYYSLDPVERAATRSTMPLGTQASHWWRMASQLDVKGRHGVVLCGVRDGEISLPDPEKLRARLRPAG